MPPRASLYMVLKYLRKSKRCRSHQKYESVNNQIQETVLVAIVVATFKRSSENSSVTTS